MSLGPPPKLLSESLRRVARLPMLALRVGTGLIARQRRQLSFAYQVLEQGGSVRGASDYTINARVMFQGPGQLDIGPGVSFGYELAGASLQPILLQVRARTATISLGSRTSVMNGCQFFCTESISIGSDCLIGAGCTFMDSNFHQVALAHRRTPPPSRPVVVGDNVWLGMGVLILPGVTVGDDAVVGAGSVVTKSVLKGDIVAGNPARVIGSAYAQ